MQRFRFALRPALCATALAAGLALAAAPARASVCMQHKILVSYLTEKFAETPRALGLVASRNVMEVYVSGKGTWTIVMTSTEGISCIVAAGDTWEEISLAAGDGREF